MRRLLLLRHAKAERAHPGVQDHDRVLAERGRADAAKLGTYLARHAFTPDRVLVSTASRTRETWALMATAFAKAPPSTFEERIYNASRQTILKAIHETEPKSRTLLVVGHNPGLHELASHLVASGDVDARRRLGEEFPTAALAAINFAIDDWRSVHARSGRLEHFVTPHWLESATD
jgi:phosphohistidine phosphatase